MVFSREGSLMVTSIAVTPDSAICANSSDVRRLCSRGQPPMKSSGLPVASMTTARSYNGHKPSSASAASADLTGMGKVAIPVTAVN